MQLPIISVLIFLPLLGIVPLLFLDQKNHKVLKGFTLVLSLVEFILSLRLWFGFNDANGGMQFVERYNWLPQYGISYYVGVDGFSLLLILLTTLPHPHLRVGHLGGRPVPGQGIHDLPLVPDERHDRRLRLPGHLPLLRLLGSAAHPHVPAHRGLGQSGPSGVRRHQVLSVHHVRLACSC